MVSLVVHTPGIEHDAQGEDGVMLALGHDVHGNGLPRYDMLITKLLTNLSVVFIFKFVHYDQITVGCALV